MPNMSPKKTEIDTIDEHERMTTFHEVIQPYTMEKAILEASRCIQCKHRPCVSGCTINNNIPEFLAAIVNEDMLEAYKILQKTTVMPAICGRVCPHEKLCEGVCTRGIRGEPVAIGMLESFVADYYFSHYHTKEEKKQKGKKVAIVGSGPAGLACGYMLSEKGYQVTLYEKENYVGGLLNIGIPGYRLGNDIVDRQIDYMKESGMIFKTNVTIGKDISINDLLKENQAVFLGNGVQASSSLHIEGEDKVNVVQAITFLKEVLQRPISLKGKNVIVVGGGNVAMDASRTAIRLGAKSVKIVYRRLEEDLPARLEEIEAAKEEGVEFNVLLSPAKVIGENHVEGLECNVMEVGEKSDDGRNTVKQKQGVDSIVIPADMVIAAIGQIPSLEISDTTEGLHVSNRNYITVNEETMETNIKGVYAGGDIVTGALTVVHATKQGMKAAKAIDEYIRKVGC